jgi:hypothetical protein
MIGIAVQVIIPAKFSMCRQMVSGNTKPDGEADHPCPKCGKPMDFARAIIGSSGSCVSRTYECGECFLSNTEINPVENGPIMPKGQ